MLRKAHRIRVLGADVPAPLKVLPSFSANAAALDLSYLCTTKQCLCK